VSVFDKELVQEVDESAGYDDLGAAGSGVAEAILTVFVQLDMNYGGRERKNNYLRVEWVLSDKILTTQTE